jgi:acyl-coenzyme A synthetase/AMP-(fatty) acid ligase
MHIFLTYGQLADKVKRFVASKTGLNTAAFKMHVVDEIPKNDAGKTLYRELEKWY